MSSSLQLQLQNSTSRKEYKGLNTTGSNKVIVYTENRQHKARHKGII